MPTDPFIFAYGNGEMLKNVFTAITLFINKGGESSLKPLMMMGGLVGGVWALSKALWDTSIQGLLLHWLIPMVVFVGVCVVPTMTVNIKDILVSENVYTVANVPLGLGATAQTLSTIGYAVTSAIEVAFHMPDNPAYNKTGMIFGSENLLEMSRYAIADEDLADTMRDFVHNCVVYDLLLKLYSIDDLKKSPDIFGLIKNNTSNVRMFSFCAQKVKPAETEVQAEAPKAKSGAAEGGAPRPRPKPKPAPTLTPEDKRGKCPLVSCKDGAGQLESLLTPYVARLKSHHLLQHLPFFYEQLTGFAQNAESLITQQVMMHSLIDAVERKCESNGIGTNFAIRRAYLQQRNTYEVVGGLAAKSLVVLRNVLEALIYASFLFIVPFALIPMGFKVFLKWLWLLVWIQLWPPFYAFLNAGIMTVSRHQVGQIPGISEGLTLFTSTGLHNLALDMQTYAAYASLSVPFLSYALLQGGISVLAQVAGSITGVASSAGATAAQDLTTGNYSYGNVQVDTSSYGNQTMLQSNLAPSLTTGHFRENYGDTGAIYGKDNTIVQDQISQLPVDIDLREAYGDTMRRSAGASFDAGTSTRESYTESQSDVKRQTAEWMRNAADNAHYNQVLSSDSSKTVSTASSEAVKQADSWGRKFGLGTQASCELLAEAGLSTKEHFISKVFPAHCGISGKTSTGASASEVYESAKNFAKESDFTKTYQALENSAMNAQINQNDEIGKRLSIGINKSYEESQAYAQQSDQHFQKAKNLSRLADYVESRTVGVTYKENQELVNFLANQKTQNGKERGIHAALHMIRQCPEEFHAGVDQFVAMKVKSLGARVDLSTEAGFNEATSIFDHKNTTPDMKYATKNLHKQQAERAQYREQEKTAKQTPSIFQYKQPGQDSFSKGITQEINEKEKKIATEKITLQIENASNTHRVDQKNAQQQRALQQGTERLQQEFEAEQNKTVIRRALNTVPYVRGVSEGVATVYNWVFDDQNTKKGKKP